MQRQQMRACLWIVRTFVWIVRTFGNWSIYFLIKRYLLINLLHEQIQSKELKKGDSLKTSPLFCISIHDGQEMVTHTTSNI